VSTCFCGSGLGGVSLSPRLGDLQDVRCLSLSPPFLSTWFCGSGLGRLARGAWDLTWALLLQAIRAFRVRVSWFACFSRSHYSAESHLPSCLSLIRIQGASVIFFCAVKGDEFSEFSVPDSVHSRNIFGAFWKMFEDIFQFVRPSRFYNWKETSGTFGCRFLLVGVRRI
jgi:hypothetical protein